MRIICIVILFILTSAFRAEAQLGFENAIFKKIRNESYDDALAYGNKKLSRIPEKKYYKKAIPYHLGLGMTYRKMGNYPLAEKHYFEARRILKYKQEHGMRKKIIDYDVFDELGLMYLGTGNFYEAEDIVKEGIQAREARFAKTNLLRYRSYLIYGNYFFHIRNYDSAYAYFKKYIFYIKNSRHTSKEELNRYADTYKLLTEMELSRNNATQALLYAKKNKHLQFHPWTRKEAGKNNLNKVLALNLLSETYRMLGDYKKAEEYSHHAFLHYNKVIKGESYGLVPLLMNRGFICWNKGNMKGAEADFVRASSIQSDFIDKNFKSLSEYEKENFYASMKKNFDVLNSFAAEKTLKNFASDDSIWNIVYDLHIKTKAILLNESNRILEVIQHSGDQELIARFNEWCKLKNELSKKIVVDGFDDNDASIRELKYSINHLEKQMSQKTSLFEENRKDPSWKDIRDRLQQKEAAVEVIRLRLYGDLKMNNTYYRKFKKAPGFTKGLSDSIAYVFLIVSPQYKTPEVLFIREGNILEGKHYRFYQNSKIFKIEDNKSYNQFWKPVADKLKGFDNIYFSADGVYNLINPWILSNPLTGKFLIDEVNIINVTNTRVILSPQAHKADVSTVLLLGRPNYSRSEAGEKRDSSMTSGVKVRGISQYFRSGIADLPGTETEVKSIASYLNKHHIQTRTLLWNEATEDSLKESASNHVLHIATHGFFDPDKEGRSPMLRSGLLLAGVAGVNQNDTEDGILTAYEASNLDLRNTHLVVLSACETGLGEVKDGEGVYGLQRAFEVAGVDAILMSMWKVNDQATQELMVAFYEELLNNRSILDSFRKAQLTLRKKYPEPLYWGAFKLIGE